MKKEHSEMIINFDIWNVWFKGSAAGLYSEQQKKHMEDLMDYLSWVPTENLTF